MEKCNACSNSYKYLAKTLTGSTKSKIYYFIIKNPPPISY